MVSVTLRMSGERWPLRPPTDGSRTLSRRRSLGWKRILFVLVGFFIYFYFFLSARHALNAGRMTYIMKKLSEDVIPLHDCQFSARSAGAPHSRKAAVKQKVVTRGISTARVPSRQLEWLCSVWFTHSI